jgi:hypothetical protein
MQCPVVARRYVSKFDFSDLFEISFKIGGGLVVYTDTLVDYTAGFEEVDECVEALN